MVRGSARLGTNFKVSEHAGFARLILLGTLASPPGASQNPIFSSANSKAGGSSLSPILDHR